MGLAWVDGYLYFHFGRALINLSKQGTALYAQTSISPGVLLGDVIEEFRKAKNTPTKNELNKRFLTTVISPDSTVAAHLKLWSIVESSLRPLLDAGFALTGFGAIDNYRTSGDFAVLIDVKYTNSLLSFYRAADIKASNPTLYTKVPERAEEVIAAKPAPDRSKKETTFPVDLNICELGFEFPDETMNNQGRVMPLTMRIHKSALNEFYLSPPDELHAVFDPIIEAYSTGRLMRLTDGSTIRAPLTTTGTPLKQRKIFWDKHNSEGIKLLFNVDLLTFDGPLLDDASRVIRYSRSINNSPVVLAIFEAYKNFLLWITLPDTLIKPGKLSGELLDVVDDQGCPVHLETQTDRLNYLYTRGRNMNSGVRWSSTADKQFVDPKLQKRVRSPKLSDYDKYALYRGKMELEIRNKHYLNKQQRAEYITRRWLPWFTQSFVFSQIRAIPEDNYYHTKFKLPPGDEPMKQFIRESAKKFGRPVVTGVI
jgi:hypothetical protein